MPKLDEYMLDHLICYIFISSFLNNINASLFLFKFYVILTVFVIQIMQKIRCLLFCLTLENSNLFVFNYLAFLVLLFPVLLSLAFLRLLFTYKQDILYTNHTYFLYIALYMIITINFTLLFYQSIVFYFMESFSLFFFFNKVP